MPIRAVVCLPTYDERDNIEPMIRALGDVLDTARDRVLVIDDGSPDGTGVIADRLASELPWLDVLHRTVKDAAHGKPAHLDAEAVNGLVAGYFQHANFEEQVFLPLAESILGRDDNHMAALGMSLHMRHAKVPVAPYI